MNEQSTKIDFDIAIQNLHRKSNRARTTRTIISTILLTIIFSFVLLIVTDYSSNGALKSFSSLARGMISNYDQDPDKIFLKRIDAILEKSYPHELIRTGRKLDGETVPDIAPLSKEQLAQNMETVERLLTMYERSRKTVTSTPENSQSATYTSLLPMVAFSVGAVALMILAIQISVMFMKYYSQLAELYDSQATALQASDGNFEAAIRFNESFTLEKVYFGRTPTTLYEKTFEFASEIIKSKSK